MSGCSPGHCSAHAAWRGSSRAPTGWHAPLARGTAGSDCWSTPADWRGRSSRSGATRRWRWWPSTCGVGRRSSCSGVRRAVAPRSRRSPVARPTWLAATCAIRPAERSTSRSSASLSRSPAPSSHSRSGSRGCWSRPAIRKGCVASKTSPAPGSAWRTASRAAAAGHCWTLSWTGSTSPAVLSPATRRVCRATWQLRKQSRSAWRTWGLRSAPPPMRWGSTSFRWKRSATTCTTWGACAPPEGATTVCGETNGAQRTQPAQGHCHRRHAWPGDERGGGRHRRPDHRLRHYPLVRGAPESRPGRPGHGDHQGDRGHNRQVSGVRVRLASTIGLIDSGIVPALAEQYRRRSGVEVGYAGAGTSAALERAKRGGFELVLAHAPSLEEQFVRDGYGLARYELMQNDFVLFGPRSDPAGIRTANSAAEAVRRIAASRAVFLTRGDGSGTHVKELDVWAAAEIDPRGQPWYRTDRSGALGNSAAAEAADALEAYILVDRATALAVAPRLRTLAPLYDGDPLLLNVISAIPIDPTRVPDVDGEQGARLLAWLLGPEARQLIATFGVDRFGRPLYVPRTGRIERAATDASKRRGGERRDP